MHHPAIQSFNIPENHPEIKTVQFCKTANNRWLA